MILVVVIWLNSLRIRLFNNDKYIIDFPSLPLILFSFLDSVILYNNLFAPKKMYYKSNLVIWAQPFFLSHPSYYCLGSSNQVIFSNVRKRKPIPIIFYPYIHLPWFPSSKLSGLGKKGDWSVKEEGFQGKWKHSHEASFIKNWKYQFQFGGSNGNNQ